MSFLRKLLELPKDDDGVFTIPIQKKTMIQYGLDVKGDQYL